MAQHKIVRGGQVITSTAVVEGDVLIDGDRIAGIVAHGADGWADAEIIDAAGCYVFPGLIDPHTHIQLDTGIYQTSDDWQVGTMTAAFGGVTTVVDFATQFPGMTFRQALDARLDEAKPALIDYGFHMMVTDLPHDPEKARAWLAELRDMGVPSIKLYTTYRPNYYADDALFLHTFRAMPRDMIAMIHCENDSIVSDATARLVEAGRTTWVSHGIARPPEAEVEAIRRMIYLSKVAGAAIYIVHCSTDESIRTVAEAKQDANRPALYCETCPQYFWLNDGRYNSDNAEKFILQPPLRPRDWMVDLLEWNDALSGVVTDHCDYTLAQKREFTEFTKTPGGLPGLETSFQLTYTYAVEEPRYRVDVGTPLALPELARLMSTEPARIFGLYPRKGAILPGSDADLMIYDPEPEVVIRAAEQHTVAGYTPYEGFKVKGRVRTVISRGDVLVHEGQLHGEPGRGQFLHGTPFTPLAG
ncbi:MAG TPA: dihydropyrimidinase [Aggregatilinea sp.]|uniref:dihydropyrimidinase n=1 Tax=Aggregatilinea sp. TaxID=2806333 RepID=UPI002CA3CDF8|nr:dihydropyrimidinase [Aggregatilinea sp.]HML21203.1 dihydropyrimidinase [Aggregatilinea sp.]